MEARRQTLIQASFKIGKGCFIVSGEVIVTGRCSRICAEMKYLGRGCGPLTCVVWSRRTFNSLIKGGMNDRVVLASIVCIPEDGCSPDLISENQKN
jgi:hypothetical protein